MNSNNIYVAKLGKTVGLKGHLKLYIDSDFPEQFKQNATFLTNRGLTLKVKEYNSSRDVILFENYEDIDISKKLINQELFSTKEQTRKNCKLGKNEFFWFDLIDCKILEDGIEIGKVLDIHRYPTSDYLEIATVENLVKEGLPKNFLLPHIFDRYILEIDISNKVIIVQKAYEILENS